MNHDYYGPVWAENHDQLGDFIVRAIRRAAKAVGRAFGRLHAYQYDAPWERPRRRISIRVK